MSIWEEVKGANFVTNIHLTSWRIVEDQSRSTTRKFVSTSSEHDILEKLLDQSKPKIKYYDDEIYFKDLHYLLCTPFRYPPLPWGSRFGTRFERALLYASVDLTTAMSEVAFYRLAFLKASEGQLGGKTVSYTAFKIAIMSDRYINLCASPFKDFEEQISSQTDYRNAQALGGKMRANGVECFQYTSARDPHKKANIGVFSPKALLHNKKIETTFEYLNCYSTKEVVEFSFKNLREGQKYIFPDELFLINNQMPLPVF
jgi:hypothetical protein